MTTPTETAILALVAALAAAADEDDAAIPAPERNADLPSRLTDVADDRGLTLYLNVLDGDRANSEEMLGADLGNSTGYDLTWNVRIEFAVAGGSSSAREAAFDAGRKAIWDALKPDLTSGQPVFLGGAADRVQLVDLLPQESSNAEGLPNVKACEFIFALTYTSADPF